MINDKTVKLVDLFWELSLKLSMYLSQLILPMAIFETP